MHIEGGSVLRQLYSEIHAAVAVQRMHGMISIAYCSGKYKELTL